MRKCLVETNTVHPSYLDDPPTPTPFAPVLFHTHLSYVIFPSGFPSLPQRLSSPLLLVILWSSAVKERTFFPPPGVPQ